MSPSTPMGSVPRLLSNSDPLPLSVGRGPGEVGILDDFFAKVSRKLVPTHPPPTPLYPLHQFRQSLHDESSPFLIPLAVTPRCLPGPQADVLPPGPGLGDLRLPSHQPPGRVCGRPRRAGACAVLPHAPVLQPPRGPDRARIALRLLQGARWHGGGRRRRAKKDAHRPAVVS